MNKSITLDFTNVTNDNKNEKFNKALNIIAYQLGINKSLKPKKEYQGEGFYFYSQKELTEKWFKHFDNLSLEIYSTICSFLGLQESNVITKANVIYKGKVLYAPETGTPLNKSDLDKLVKAIVKVLNKNRAVGEKMVTESQVLGRLLEKYYKANKTSSKKMSLDDMKFDEIANKNIYSQFDIDSLQKQKIELYKDSAAQRISGIEDSMINDVKQILIDGCKNEKSKNEVSQDLFNKIGGANRDWKKIADTEIQTNLNNAYIQENVKQAEPGESVYFQRMEVIDDRTCDFCKKMHGEIVKYSNVSLESDSIEDKYASKAIWQGKEWSGGKNEIVNGPFHPHCRGVWLRWYAF